MNTLVSKNEEAYPKKKPGDVYTGHKSRVIETIAWVLV
jgi:hypothetical protein